MNFLIDTNILISAEPTSPDDVEPVTQLVATLLGELNRGNHAHWIHPESVREVSGDKDAARRTTRLVLVAKYPQLKHPPSMSARLVDTFGAPAQGSHNEVDLLLLSAVDADAVDYLVTEDDRLHRRARRAGLASRALNVADALATIRALFPAVPVPPPHVSATVAHTLHDDPILDTLRADYPDFDAWLSKCKREQRLTWLIDRQGHYAGLCIVKDETPPVPGFRGKSAKICTFKVSDKFRGYRYGELLLKAVFTYFVQNGYAATFVDVLPKHENLISLFEDFGFGAVATKARGELVMLKRFVPVPTETPLRPLEFNILYGPHAVRVADAQVFVIPIQPRFNQLLFPEAEQQLQLKSEVHPFANSMRKAYLCNSVIRKIGPGDLLLFYCSAPTQAVTAIGVADGTLVSGHAPALARYVGRRTVYPYSEIEKMTKASVLAILFRLARVLPSAWPLDLLARAGIIRNAPQSIVQVRSSEAISWIATQIGAWP